MKDANGVELVVGDFLKTTQGNAGCRVLGIGDDGTLTLQRVNIIGEPMGETWDMTPERMACSHWVRAVFKRTVEDAAG